MGHKILQDHAHVFCQMFMGWRMQDDLATLASLPEGELMIDVLNGECSHNEVGSVKTYIAGEIAAWFDHRLTEHKIPREEILKAELRVKLRRLIPNPKKRSHVTFNWACSAVIVTVDREYHSHLAEPHSWMGVPDPIITPSPPRDVARD